MMNKKGPLGRGLGALITDNAYEKKSAEEVVSTGSIAVIDIEKIEVNPFQPRTQFDEEALNELSESIKQLGIIQPITVRKLENGNFQIISGERRYRASKLAGLKEMPAFVRDANDQSMLEMALVENIQREDLNAIEIAITYQRLMDECSLTQEVLGDRVGKKRSTVSNYLRLLRLPAEIQAAIRDKQLSMGHARALISIEKDEDQMFIFYKILSEGLSVRAVEQMVKQLNEPEPVKEEIAIVEEIKQEETTIIEDVVKQPEDELISNEDDEIEQEELKFAEKVELPETFVRVRENLTKKFNTNVDLRREPTGKGRIIISFKTDEEFNRIVSLFGNDQQNN